MLEALDQEIDQAAHSRRQTRCRVIIPSGLTFNPDGQAIYYTIAAIFIAQATDTPLTLTGQLIVLAVLVFTSKGSAGDEPGA